MPASPKFITKLKERTIQTKNRKKMTFSPQREVLEKLQKISDQENVSVQKLLEYSMEMLHRKYSAATKGAA